MDKTKITELIVVKRSGQRIEFNELKIALAIKKAFDSVTNNYQIKDINKVYECTIEYIKTNYSDRKTINVEDIQDIIEDILKNNKYQDVYDSFSLYRNKRNESRKVFKTKSQHKFVKAIEKINTINKNEEKPNNILYNLGGIISEEYTKSYILDNKYVRAYDEGKIFIHNFSYFNLGYLSNTHLLLTNTLKKDNCFYDILSLLIEAKKEINGEIEINDIDILLGQYILDKYKLELNDTLYKYLNVVGFIGVINYKKIRDKIDKIKSINEDFSSFDEFLLNSQLKMIFTNAHKDTINKLTLYISNNINKLFNTLNNSYQKNDKYSFSLGIGKSDASLLIKKIILEEVNKSLRLNNICIIYKVNKDSNIDEITKLILNNKNIKLNFIKENNISEYFSSGYKIPSDNNITLVSGRANIANTSINISRLGLRLKELNDEFYKELDEILELTKNELLFVFELIGDKNKENYKVLFNENILDDEKLECGQKIRKVIKSGTININLIGLSECVNYISKDNYENTTLKILKYIKNKIDNFCIETKLNFTLSCINDISASKKFIEIDKTVYGLIDKITNKDNYDNINFINDIDNIKNLLVNINKYQELLSGGSITEISLPKNITNKRIIELTNILVDFDVGFVDFKVGD